MVLLQKLLKSVDNFTSAFNTSTSNKIYTNKDDEYLFVIPQAQEQNELMIVRNIPV